MIIARNLHFNYFPTPFLQIFLGLLICSNQSFFAQDKTVHASTVTSTAQANTVKLARTQGSSKYANVHCSLQDHHGNYWFGTTGEGIYHYDGRSFTQFTEEDGLSSNFVWCVYEDKEGRIWFGTADGACRYEENSPRSLFLKFMVATTVPR
jgi:ligand-binding sensor domain-containing protein